MRGRGLTSIVGNYRREDDLEVYPCLVASDPGSQPGERHGERKKGRLDRGEVWMPTYIRRSMSSGIRIEAICCRIHHLEHQRCQVAKSVRLFLDKLLIVSVRVKCPSGWVVKNVSGGRTTPIKRRSRYRNCDRDRPRLCSHTHAQLNPPRALHSLRCFVQKINAR